MSYESERHAAARAAMARRRAEAFRRMGPKERLFTEALMLVNLAGVIGLVAMLAYGLMRAALK